MIHFLAALILLLSGSSFAQNICESPYSNYQAINLSKCPKLNQFYQTYKDSKMYLVIASPFLKNPASLFGHNFILFSKSAHNDSISGITLNFEAVDTSKGVLEYAYKGLFGKFDGRYSIRQFYNNIKLYNNFEDRDLIVYPITASNEEIKRYLFKAWEYTFHPPQIPYYFLNGNCAFYITDFLRSDKPTLNLSGLYYSPLDTLVDLKIPNKPIVRASIKKRVQLYSQRNEEISELYADAQFNVYKAERGQKNKKLNTSLRKLNEHKVSSGEKLPKIATTLNKQNFKPYGNLRLGSSSKSRWHFAASAVNNSYYDELGVNHLKLIDFTTNDFHGRETEFSLLSLESIQNYEKYFKDLSWNMGLFYQNKASLDFVSTNAQIGMGAGKVLLNRLYLSLELETILDSRFVDFYPSAHIEGRFESMLVQIQSSVKYRTPYFKTAVFKILSKNTKVGFNFEDFKEHETRVYTTLDWYL